MKVNSPEDAEIIVQKLPSDIGIHRNPRKGTLNAPDEILEGLKLDREILIDEVFPDEFDLEETHGRVEENTEDLLSYNKPLISIGGDHSVSFPVIKTVKQKYTDLKLVWLDSHLDMKKKVDGHVSHDVVVRELLNHGFSPDDIYLVGITRMDEDEEDFIGDKEFNTYGPEKVEEFLREFNSDEQPVYLSVDIDVLKERLAPGTGYPDGELELEQVVNIIEGVEPNFCDLVEFAPSLDDENRTLESAVTVFQTLVRSSPRY